MSRNAKMYISFKDSVTWSEQKKFHSSNIFSPFLFSLFTIETFAVFLFLYLFTAKLESLDSEVAAIIKQSNRTTDITQLNNAAFQYRKVNDKSHKT